MIQDIEYVELYPKIIVYKNMFNDPDAFLKQALSSKPWHNWYVFGEMLALEELDQLRLVESLDLPDLAWDLQMMLNQILNPAKTLETCFAGLNRLIVGLKQSGLYVIGVFQ